MSRRSAFGHACDCYQSSCDRIEDRFGFEPEITAKVARLRLCVFDVGISYSGRTYEEGKKVGWRDEVQVPWCISKYGLVRRVTSSR